jgi:GAF domain-containing protein
LQVINSSPGDLAPVFDAMLERAMHLCQASGGALRAYEGGAFYGVALRGVSAAFGEATREVRTHPESGLGRIERGARVVQIADIADPGQPRAGTYRRRAMVQLGGIRTALWVALRKDEVLRGTFVLYRSEVRPFSEKQIALVENFAAQAVIAMENARLITETREALEQQTATSEVLQVINSSPGDLAPVFDAMLDRALSLCGAVFGRVATYDGEFFHVVAKHDEPQFGEARQRGPRRPETGTAWPQIVSGENVVHIADLMDTKLYREGHEAARSLVDTGGCRTQLSVALRKDYTLLGAITIYRKQVRPFADRQIALLQNFAAQAVIAMENARLMNETREALEQQTATAEVLGVINSSPGDLAPVFEAILDKAHSLCGADLGSLFTFDSERFWPVAAQRPPSVRTVLPVGAIPRNSPCCVPSSTNCTTTRSSSAVMFSTV